MHPPNSARARRAFIPLVIATVLGVSAPAAQAEPPLLPGDSGADQYVPSLPSAEGDRPAVGYRTEPEREASLAAPGNAVGGAASRRARDEAEPALRSHSSQATQVGRGQAAPGDDRAGRRETSNRGPSDGAPASSILQDAATPSVVLAVILLAAATGIGLVRRRLRRVAAG